MSQFSFLVVVLIFPEIVFQIKITEQKASFCDGPASELPGPLYHKFVENERLMAS